MKQALHRFFALIRTQGIAWISYRVFYAYLFRPFILRVRLSGHRRSERFPIAIRSKVSRGRSLDATSTVESTVNSVAQGVFRFYSRHDVALTLPPDWNADPFSGVSYAEAGQFHWTELHEDEFGDVKNVWELSRFSFVCGLVDAYIRSGDQRAARIYWLLLTDWMQKNPFERGIQWMCGQETALRSLQLVLGYRTFEHDPSTTSQNKSALGHLLLESGRRIAANVGYAISQRNNHGISEAVGLYCIGATLRVSAWVVRGEKLLIRLLRELVYPDGSFSQHSTNYHRLVVSTLLAMVAVARMHGLSVDPFISEKLYAAAWWLFLLTDTQTGWTPNLGPNDGSEMFQLPGSDYRDHRPVIQVASAVVDGTPWVQTEAGDRLTTYLFGATYQGPDQASEPRAQPLGRTLLKSGGYAIWRRSDSLALFRCPRTFLHRPSHADLLHFDLTYRGINVLRDGGTYSYQGDPEHSTDLSGVTSHNTVQFDEHDQMKRLGRFLFADWPSLKIHEESSGAVSASYRDAWGCMHERQVNVGERAFEVTDRIDGFERSAVLRWRLAPELEWHAEDDVCASSIVSIRIIVDPSARIELRTGYESLYYMERTEIPVLEVHCVPGTTYIASRIELLA